MSGTYAATCDQNFPSVKLRAGTTIPGFTDRLNNGSAYTVIIDDARSSVNFSNIYGGPTPVFSMVSANQQIPAGSSSIIIGSNAYTVPIPAPGAVRQTNAIDIVYNVVY